MNPALALCVAALLSACVSHDTRAAYKVLRYSADRISPPLPTAVPPVNKAPNPTSTLNPLLEAACTDEDAEEVLRRAAINLQILTQPN